MHATCSVSLSVLWTNSCPLRYSRCRPDNFADHLVDEKIAISEYSLSASVACGKVRSRPDAFVVIRHAFRVDPNADSLSPLA